MSAIEFRDRTALVGIGATEYSRNSRRSVEALALEACRNAIADAGLTAQDVDGVGHAESFAGNPA